MNQKVVLHPPSSTHHQNKKKVSVLKSEILIKYKNQMDPCNENATLIRLSGR